MYMYEAGGQEAGHKNRAMARRPRQARAPAPQAMNSKVRLPAVVFTEFYSTCTCRVRDCILQVEFEDTCMHNTK